MKNLITKFATVLLLLVITDSSKAQCPTITITPTSIVLQCGVGAGTFTANTTPNTNVSNMWYQPGSNTPLVGQYCTPGAAGIYTFACTNLQNQCTTTQTVQVIANACLPSVSITAQSNNYYVTCVTCVTMQVSTALTGSCGANVGFVWTDPSGNFTLSTSSTYSTCIPGNVRLHAWNMATPQCSVVQMVSVLQNTTAPVASFTSTVWGTNSPTLTCTNPCVILTGSSTAMSYSVNWLNSSNNGSPTISICSTTNTSQTTVGTPSVQIVDLINGCVTKLPVPVYQNIVPPTLSVVSSPSILCAGQTGTLTATSSASNYTWSTGSNASSIVVSPSVATNYTVTSTNTSNGCTGTTVFSVTNCSGINSLSMGDRFGVKLYPNPNNGNFTFSLNSGNNSTLEIINTLGQIVFSTSISEGNNSIDVSHLAKGLYHYVLLENKQAVHSGKLIIE